MKRPLNRCGPILLAFFLTMFRLACAAQAGEVQHLYDTLAAPVLVVQDTVPKTIAPVKKTELFNSGFIDFQNSAQMNASARVFKLYVGEPGKFTLPLSIYSGVSGAALTGGTSATRGLEPLVLGLINPMSGNFNFFTDHAFGFGKNRKSITQLFLIYQLGEKMLTGQQVNPIKNFSFFSTYGNIGLHFQTGAWEKDKEKNMGIFWVLMRYHIIKTSSSFQALSGYPPARDLFKGFSAGTGIDINNVLNIKFYYYRYLRPGSSDFGIPIYQITFNYSLKS